MTMNAPTTTPAPDPMSDPTREFSGNPRRYRQIAIWSTVGLAIWIYGAFAAIQYFGYGQTWPLGWKPLLITTVFAIWYGRYFYRSMMRLDAQYGGGGSWQLTSRMVKLPELRQRKRSTPPA